MACILMMNPKDAGIGMGIGGVSAGGGRNEYGSKKTMEGKLKKVAFVCSILFVLVCLFLPFVD
ncbi:preprotein translocase subunit SecG [bacterium]|nr:preprotein translocase subunit SecG [bacterium]